MKRNILRLFVIELFFFWICPEIVANKVNQVWEKDGCNFHLSYDIPSGCDKIILEIHSDRNKDVSKLTDVSPDNTRGENQGMVHGKDMWFPVIDLQLKENLHAVAIVANVSDGDHYSWNSNFWNSYAELRDTLVFANHLEHWENHIYVESETAELKSFYLQEIVELSGSGNHFDYQLTTLSPVWSGTIKIYSHKAGEKLLLDEEVITDNTVGKEIQTDSDLIRENLITSLSQSISFILSAQNLNPLSPTYGGLFLFYDLDSKMYRRSDWMWTYGPAIKLLLDASKIPELAEEFGYEKLIETARLIGEASLRFQMLDKDHPAYGITICRYDPRMIYDEGFSGYLSPADAHFLAGWGWIPLYEATGDQRFLNVAILQSEQIGKVMEGDSIVEQDFVLKANKWKNWTMDESGFGMIGFSETYKYTKNEKHKQIGKEYLDGLINVLEDPSGLWYRTFHRNQADHTDDCWPTGRPVGTPILMKDGQTTRGNGWAMIGLLSAHQMMPEGDYYLKKAIALAENVIGKQLDDGSFPWQLYVDPQKVGISEKGTPLWSLLLYQLYQYTDNPKYLEAAQKALLWCMEHQYTGDDILARGGIVGDTWASGIVYRHYYPLICTYTMDWFGLAALEQLILLENN
ncbi:glycoside hydrolase family protein [Sunxiuqinia indica]|uniref:hypothetical protein n=1 Tax=Sunxiuqinia indica TaxID=2692584 RepID=UPI001359E90C|nr:hypothetical protein [Sunxiuqinia indica]